MPFPIIPILAIAGILGGIATLSWYADLSEADQVRADRLALQWFGTRFQELSEYQKSRIMKHLS